MSSAITESLENVAGNVAQELRHIAAQVMGDSQNEASLAGALLGLAMALEDAKGSA